MDRIPVWRAAQELNVRPQCVHDFIKAGHLTAVDGQVTRDSLDELKWTAALRMDTIRTAA